MYPTRRITVVIRILIMLFVASAAQVTACSMVYARMVGGLDIKQGTWMGQNTEYVGGQILLKVEVDADSALLDSLIVHHDLSLRKCFDRNRWGLMECDTSADIFEIIDSLMTSPLVEWAEPNVVLYPARKPNDPYLTDSSEWSFWNTGKHGLIDADIDAPEAWDIDTGRGDLIISVLDTGFPYVETESGPVYCHEDLSDPEKYVLGYICYDTCWSGPLEEGQGGFHGGPVVGIISAMTNNGKGGAGMIWACRVYVNKTFVGIDPIATASGTADAIDSSLSFGAKLINISGWGGAVSLKLENAIGRANDSGCVIVAADIQVPSIYASWGQEQPDGYRNVIAVGGTGSDDTHEYGCSSGEFQLTVVAPCRFLEAPGTATYDTATQDCSGYGVFDQTSCATPHVTGVAGLLMSHALSQGRSLPPDSVRWYLEMTADDIEEPGWDSCTAFGRINALRALMALEGCYPNATGHLRTNAAWGDTLGDTLYVLGDVVVPEGCTLTIDQGAVVKFLTNDREDFGDDSTKCELIVKGTLIIEGNDSNWVCLMSDSTSPGDSDWGGITVDSAGTIDIEYCSIQHALQPVPWDSTDAYTLNHVEFRRCHTWPSHVDSAETIRVVDCLIPNFDTAMTVESWGALEVDSCEFDSGEMGMLVKLGGSAVVKNSDMANAYTGIQLNNSAHDTVIGCTFKDMDMHGIDVESNPNLVIDGCIFVDSTDSGTYGILCKQDISITNSFFQGYLYGIKVTGLTKFAGSSPLVEECGFYNMREIGIWSACSSSPTIQNCCFKGSYDMACIQVDGGGPYIEKCYMASENDEFPFGMLFTNDAGGTIRRTTIWDYDSCAVMIADSLSDPDFGNADSAGNNWFEETDHYYFISNSNATILAKSNYWGTDNSSEVSQKIMGTVDIDSILVCPPNPYYSDQCSDLPPSDYGFDPCHPQKIAVTPEDQKGQLPQSFSLSQNYPNPFNPQTVIKYDLPRAAHVELIVYNVLGQKVRTLADEWQEPGHKTLVWEGKDDEGGETASGVYFFRLKANGFESVKRMILLR